LFLPEYDKKSVDLAKDPEFASQAYLLNAPSQPPSDLDQEVGEMDVWKRWIAQGVPVSDTQQLIVLQSEPFDREYETFDVDLQAAPDCKADDGVCFLVSGPQKWSRPVYRQIRFTAATKDTHARICIRHPMPGEYLLLIVRFVSKSNSKLPMTPVQYDLRLKVRS
jgi:hypothetical protein